MAGSDPADIPEGVPEERVDELYGLPLSEFTPSRDALAKELRKEGEREAADWVKGLRKPSAAAWVVNQLARTQRSDAKRLLDSGAKLRDAYEKLAAGRGDAAGLRQATEKQRQAAAALLELAPGLLDRDGQAPSPATLDRVGETLHAVALEDDARREFEAGRLTRERRASGLPLVGAPGAGAAPRAPTRAKGKGKKPARGDGAAERRAQARQALKEARERHRATQRAVTEAEREVERAEREVARAESAREKAASALADARAAEAEAERRVADAESAIPAPRR